MRTCELRRCGPIISVMLACAGAVSAQTDRPASHKGNGAAAGAGDCCVSNGSPGCENQECEDAVCGADPFCCGFLWDETCATLACDFAVCECPDCEQVVCGDRTCDPIKENCKNCPADCGACPPEDCCSANGSPGCDIPACEDAVCALDGFCCSVLWESNCATLACDFPVCECTNCEKIICGDGSCDPIEEDCVVCPADCGECPPNDCCLANGTPGCDDDACEAAVCGVDPFCCADMWDDTCAEEACDFAICDCMNCEHVVCGDGSCDPIEEDCDNCPADCGVCPPEDCCSANGSPGCDIPACEGLVCGVDPFCCDMLWDDTCSEIACDFSVCRCTNCADVVCGDGVCHKPEETCGVCPEDCGVCPAGDCCVSNGSPGCDDPVCEGIVCGMDPACCGSLWDNLCAEEACGVPECNCPGCGDDCPSAMIVATIPPAGTRDARQPHNPGAGQYQDPMLRQGIGSATEPITLVMTGVGASADCFMLCETAPDAVLGSNSIASVTEGPPGAYEIILHHAAAPGAWTTISYPGGASVAFLAHPANANADGLSNANDVLSLINVLNGVESPAHGDYSTDIDHSGATNASDVLRLIDLLNGAVPYDTWNGVATPENICP